MRTDRLNNAVAENCSSFNPKINMFESVVETVSPSCDICRHFINKRCELNLYDSIIDNISMF